MSAAEEMKLARNLALDKLKAANKKLQDSVAGDRQRNAERYHRDITEAFTNFENYHIQYVLKSKQSLEDQENREKFFEASELVDVAETTWSKYQEDLANKEAVRQKEEADTERQRKKLDKEKKVRAKLMNELQEIVALSSIHVNEVDSGVTANKTVMSNEIIYLEGRMKQVKVDIDNYIEEIDDDAAKTILDEKSRSERFFRQNVFKVRSYTDEDVGGSSTAPSATGSRSSSPSTNSFRYKKIEFPKFSGIIRNYATFKRDFDDIVVQSHCYDKKHMSHILRHECLTGEAKTLVHNIHEYDMLWKKLNDKYDDESEVVEQISNQIASLRKVEEEDYDGFVKLVDVIERANLDMSATGSTTVLNNPLTVRLIMTKCPKVIKESLAGILATKSPTEEYDAMLQFLIQKRKEAQRLARIQEQKPPARPQHKAKGSTNAAEGKRFDQKSANGKKQDNDRQSNWSCMVQSCTYKSKHFLSACKVFKKMSVNERGKLVLDKKICVLCLSPGHGADDCPKKQAGWKECDTGQCGKWHSRLLHGAVVPGLALATRTGNPAISGSRTLLLAQSIPTANGKTATTIWDTGSTISLINNDFALDAGFEGADCCFELTGVGEKKETYSTKLYIIPLMDTDGQSKEIHAFGIDNITSDLAPVSLQAAAGALDLPVEQLQRPVGQVHLLVGMNYTDILPAKERIVNKIGLYKSAFGTGYVIGGTLDTEESGEEKLDNFAYQVCAAGGRGIKPIDFLSAEAFGVEIPSRCKYCRGCKECGFRAKQLTYTEAKELSVIEDGLTLDPVKKIWTAKYPFSTDPSILKNNYSQAMACMLSLEKRLDKTKQMPQFNEQFQDAVDRGVFREISREEADRYKGPVNYVTITEAYKEGDQVTTPLRLCMNSSMRYQGVSLNDLLMKGPSALNNIYSVLLNFRTYPVAFVKDLSKFYQSVQACERDQHLRRVIWRGGKEDIPPKIYITQTVNFGDKPAGCMALTCVRETADLYKNIDQEAAYKLKNDNYVDDVASGAETHEDAVRVSTNMDKIVEMGGFRFKSTVMSGDEGDPKKVLGTGWDTQKDQLFVEVKVNPSAKRKGVKILPDIPFDDVKAQFPQELTKRIIWRVVLGQYDLLGLASVFFIRLKLLMRDLSNEEGQKIGWDTPLPEELRIRFIDTLEMMGGIQNLRFPRCIKPTGHKKDKKPDLLIFGDGSKQAFCSLAYIRWEMESGGFKCFLVSGKTRVAPIKKISVPRLELLGALASVRLAASIQESMSLEIGKRFFFTDSSAVFGMIKGDCGAFMEFVGTRTGEIKNKSDPDSEWFWVPTDQNLADMGTRSDVTPAVLHPDSKYLNGTDWMNDVFEAWPVSKTPGGKIPNDEMIPAARVLHAATDQPLIQLNRFSSFEKACKTMAVVFTATENFKAKKMLKGVKKAEKTSPFTPTNLDLAEKYLISKAQEGMRAEHEKGKFSSLSPRLEKVQVAGKSTDLIVTSGRLGSALSVGYDKEKLPVLQCKSPVSTLIMKDAHAVDHGGVDRTLQRSRCVAWIIGGRRLAKTITRACFMCKLRNKELAQQVMAPLPKERLPPTPVFYNTAVDLFGPLEIRDTVKRRTSRKCWGVIFCCMVTSAIHLEVTEDYSCDSFLLCLRRFMNLRGSPAVIYSDPGSQLMAAAKQLGTWNYSRINEWAAGSKTEWKNTPTDSQHYNGCAEAMIKSTKKQLSANLKEKKFTKGEMDTLMSNVSYIINSRPLMKKASEDPLSGGPITPLHLLGGRATINIPTVNFDADTKLTKRLQFIEDTTKEFWNKWFVQVFHNLVPSYKWKTVHRNVREGDIVLLKESSQLKGEYKLARVKEAKPAEDGHVRRVTLQYKNLKPTGTSPTKANNDLRKTTFSETERSVQNVVVIVPSDWSPEDIDTAVTSGIGL